VATAAAGGSVFAVAGGLWAVLFSAGLALPNGPALALAQNGDRAGAAAAMLGAVQFGVGAAVSPVVGLLGNDATAMGAVIALTLLLALVVLVVVARPWQLPEPEDVVVAAH
jgi:DHA1 family bicyclomycin/chloramphenicol resistance-like MFS transporter